MAKLMELIKVRQGDLSNEKYANEIGLTGTTLWRYHEEKTELNARNIKKLAQYYAKKKDFEMIGALASYALDLETDLDSLTVVGQLLSSDLDAVPSA